MSVVMAASELAYVSCCFVASRRIAPQIQIRISHFTSSVSRELIWFAGSYQLVNVLEVLYAMLLPVVMLKFFGAEIAGVYALATRLVTAVLMGQDALILPLLSGGAVIFATGSKERLIRFFKKSFKLTVAITLLPLAFVGAFGALLVFVWTGQTGPHFSAAIWILCLGGFFNAISRLQLILYRASGNALHDNIRQAFRLGVLGVLSIFGNAMGFNGVLLGLAAAELIGVVYMFVAMTSTLSFFTPRLFVPDTVRLLAATAGIVLVGIAVLMIPVPLGANEHTTALIKLGEVSLACLISAFPAIALTKSISVEEQRAVLSLLIPWRRTTALGNQ
jgi:O-antigen/teichoic acid export membrane protein